MSAVRAPAQSARGRPRAQTVPRGPLLGIVVLAPLVIAYVILRNGAWVYDDNLILVLARNEGFNLGWLNREIFQHWDVGMNAVYSVLLHVFPLDYRWGLLAMLVLLGVALLTFERVLSTIGSRGWTTLGLMAWFGLSIVWIRPLQWWASGVQAIPNLAFDLICLYAVLRFWADGRDRWIAIACGALVLGLLFYEKPALMPVYLALIRALLMSERLAPADLARTFWRERRLWLSLCTVVAVWAGGYFASGAYSGSTASVTPGQYLHYFWILWSDTLLPALAGFTLPAAHLDALQVCAAAALEVAVVGLIAVSVARKPSAWRGWALVAVVVVLDGTLVAHQRVAQFGVGIGNDLRYLLDFPWLIALGLYYAFSSQRVLRPAPPPPRIAPLVLPRSSPRPAALGMMALLAAYAVAAVATAAHLQSIWGSVQSRHWEANLERSLADLSRDGPVVVADNAVPFQIISYPFAPLNRLSQVIPLYAAGIRIDGPLNGTLATIDAGGVAHRATVTHVLGDGDALALHRQRQLLVTGTSASLEPGRVCVATGPSPATVQRRIDVPTPRPPGPYYARIAYTTSRAFSSPLLEDAGHGYPPGSAASVFLAPGAPASLGWLDAGFPSRFKLTVPPHTRLCVDRVDLVTLSGAVR